MRDINEYRVVWGLAQQALQWLGSQYEPALEAAAAKLGLASPAWYTWLFAAPSFEPEALTTAGLRVRAPYSAPQFFEERLANAAAAGFLRCIDKDGYMLTPKGQAAVRAVLDTGYRCMAQLEPLPAERLEALVGLLWKLVESSLASPEPPGTWCIAHSREIDPGVDAPVVARLDQYLSDLASFRDDCHLSAWAPLGIDGVELEALTYVWRAPVDALLTLDALCAALSRRGWEKTEYQSRLDDLERRGWVTRAGDGYISTASGNAARHEVERKTDEYFYRPWDCYSEVEMEELKGLLTKMDEEIGKNG